MKKSLLTLGMVGCMIVSFSAAAMASNISLGAFGGGQWNNDLANRDDDQKVGIILNGEYNVDKYKVGLEYLSGSQKNGKAAGSDLDFNSYEVKFGYRVFQNDQFNTDLTLGYYKETYDDQADTKLDGVIIGADASYQFNEKFALSGSLGFSVNGSIDAKNAGYDGNDADILIAKIQGNYNFTDQVSGFLGYRYISSDIDNPGDSSLTNQGATLGVTYRF